MLLIRKLLLPHKPSQSNLILPGHPVFYLTLGTSLPIGWESSGFTDFVVDANSGLLRPVGQKDLDDYIYGGEYDEVAEDEDDEFYL